jgi:hypothetical protein
VPDAGDMGRRLPPDSWAASWAGHVAHRRGPIVLLTRDKAAPTIFLADLAVYFGAGAVTVASGWES